VGLVFYFKIELRGDRQGSEEIERIRIQRQWEEALAFAQPESTFTRIRLAKTTKQS
jgi:hypothetical protein